MVLVLNGVLQDECIPLDTHSLFMQHPIYRDTANQLLSIPSKTVSCAWQKDYFQLKC
jgi:protein N-terminal asparagine amidohydrolase